MMQDPAFLVRLNSGSICLFYPISDPNRAIATGPQRITGIPPFAFLVRQDHKGRNIWLTYASLD
jgi:hypothetical protein